MPIRGLHELSTVETGSCAFALNRLIDNHLAAAVTGDRAAFGRVVLACQNTVTAIALGIVRDVPASEDIAQEAFLSAWKNLGRLQNRASFLPWLRQITRNLARDHLRARRRIPHGVDDVDAAIAAAADPQPNPFEQLLEREHQGLAAEMISALPADSREVLLLYYREGQSSRQVAALLGLSDAAVRKRLSRARQVVRGELLLRFGEFAHASAPSAGFAAVITTALAMASPPAAAAGLLAATATVGAKSLGKLLLGSAGSIGLGLAGAFAGIYYGLRSQLRGAVDDAERFALVRSSVISGLASVGFMVTLLLLSIFDSGWRLPLTATLAFMAVVFHQAIVVQPRILARRHAAEARRDPATAAARRRRERWMCWIGASAGTAAGLGGLLYGLVAAGRL